MANSASNSSLASSTKLTSWNISGVKHDTCFLNESLSNCDILCLQEHWLYPDTLSFLDTIHLDFYSWGRCAKDLDIDATSRRGFGGIAFYWRKHLNVSIDVLSDLGNDRIAVLKVKLMNGNYIYIVNVYLPTASQNAATYNDSKNVVYEPLKTLFMNFMELVQFLLLVTSMPILDPLGNKKH
jgi:exonuclease III